MTKKKKIAWRAANAQARYDNADDADAEVVLAPSHKKAKTPRAVARVQARWAKGHAAEPVPELQDPEAPVEDPHKEGFTEWAMRGLWQPIQNAFQPIQGVFSSLFSAVAGNGSPEDLEEPEAPQAGKAVKVRSRRRKNRDAERQGLETPHAPVKVSPQKKGKTIRAVRVPPPPAARAGPVRVGFSIPGLHQKGYHRAQRRILQASNSEDQDKPESGSPAPKPLIKSNETVTESGSPAPKPLIKSNETVTESGSPAQEYSNSISEKLSNSNSNSDSDSDSIADSDYPESAKKKMKNQSKMVSVRRDINMLDKGVSEKGISVEKYLRQTCILDDKMCASRRSAEFSNISRPKECRNLSSKSKDLGLQATVLTKCAKEKLIMRQKNLKNKTAKLSDSNDDSFSDSDSSQNAFVSSTSNSHSSMKDPITKSDSAENASQSVQPNFVPKTTVASLEPKSKPSIMESLFGKGYKKRNANQSFHSAEEETQSVQLNSVSETSVASPEPKSQVMEQMFGRGYRKKHAKSCKCGCADASPEPKRKIYNFSNGKLEHKGQKRKLINLSSDDSSSSCSETDSEKEIFANDTNTDLNVQMKKKRRQNSKHQRKKMRRKNKKNSKSGEGSSKKSKPLFYDLLKKLIPSVVCAVCDELKEADQMHGKKPRTWEKLSILKMEDEDEICLSKTCKDTDEEISLCKSCHTCLKIGVLPANSLINNDYGDIPEELACLNSLEEKMIALYVCNTKIIVLPFGQCARIGGVAYVMNDLISNMEILPRMPEETDTILCVPCKQKGS